MTRPTPPRIAAIVFFGLALAATVVGTAQEPAAPPEPEATAEQTPPPAAATKRPRAEPVKVYRFEGMDIEGRLKAPQLLHFRRRVRAALEPRKLPHRSFVPELLSTRARGALR